MKRSEINPLPEYFERYINKCDDVELNDAIQISVNELNEIPLEKWKSIGDKVYAEGKWTIKDILQHLIDVERIFAFRALAIARDEKQKLPGFSEDEYAISANANKRNLEDLLAELKVLRESVKLMYKSFSDEMLKKTGESFKGVYSVASIGFIFPGHQRWHLDVIKDKYLPLSE